MNKALVTQNVTKLIKKNILNELQQPQGGSHSTAQHTEFDFTA